MKTKTEKTITLEVHNGSSNNLKSEKKKKKQSKTYLSHAPSKHC